MTVPTLSFGFGALLFLICILGGGFEADKVRIPPASTFARIVSGIAGFIFLLFGVGITIKEEFFPNPVKVAEQKNIEFESSNEIAAKKTDEAVAAKKKAAQEEMEAKAKAEEARKADEAQKALAAKQAQTEAEKQAALDAKSVWEQKAQAAEEARVAAEQARLTARQEAEAAESARQAAEAHFLAAKEAQTVAIQSAGPNVDIINKFKTKINRDIFGQDILTSEQKIGFFTMDINSCASKCDATESCVAFTFNRWKKQCYLKNDIATSILDPSSMIAVKKEFSLPKVSTNIAGIRIRYNSRFRGNALSTSKANDISECKDSCAADMRCVGFSFLREQGSSNSCEIFNVVADGYTPDSAADIGWKQQEP